MPKVLYIDDNKKSGFLYGTILKRMFGSEIELISIQPESKLKNMVTGILAEKDLVSLIIDERMNETGIAEYSGMVLVGEIRKIKEKLPIYILTSYPGDITENLFEVEYVIDKSDLNKPETEKQYTSRFRRHTGQYKDILSVRNEIYNKLLIKNINEGLTEEEKKDFLKLDNIRSKNIYYDDPIISKEVEKELLNQNDKLTELLKQIEDIEKKIK